jgi:hypothetical protein
VDRQIRNAKTVQRDLPTTLEALDDRRELARAKNATPEKPERIGSPSRKYLVSFFCSGQIGQNEASPKDPPKN